MMMARGSSSALPTGEPPNFKVRALRLLAARDYGRVELERKLGRYCQATEDAGEGAGANAALLQATLDELQAKGFINEERAAAAFTHRREGKWGASKVLAELKEKGIAADLIAAQADLLRESEESRLKNLWQKKFGAPPVTLQERGKQMRFLASRGFSSAAIYALMRAVAAAPQEQGAGARDSFGEET